MKKDIRRVVVLYAEIAPVVFLLGKDKLAMCLELGIGVDAEVKRTHELYKEAVDEGIAEGPVTTSTVGVERDVGKAAMF